MNYADPSGLFQQGHPLKGGSPSLDNFLRGAVNQALNPGRSKPAPFVSPIQLADGSTTPLFTQRGLNQIRQVAEENQRAHMRASMDAAGAELARAFRGWKPNVQETSGPVNRALSAAGDSIRSAGNAMGNSIEYATSGYGGTLGNAIAAWGGFGAHLWRTAGNIGASVVDVPRTFEGAMEDVRQTVRTGQQYGIRTAAARHLGILAGAEAYFGTDVMTYQEADVVSKTSEAFGRFGGAAGTVAGVGNFLSPKLAVFETAETIVSRVAQQQADKGLVHLGKHLSPDAQMEYVRNPSRGNRFLGGAVHESTNDALRELYPGRFEYRRVGPDFRDNTTGRYIELTTPGQVRAHVAKGGAYTDAGYATYVLPKYP